MFFNGAAPRVAGQITTSPGRYAGSDNGWSAGYMTSIVNKFNETLKKYPSIETIPASASIGADLPVFTKPNLAAVQK
jgi:arylsulfatase